MTGRFEFKLTNKFSADGIKTSKNWRGRERPC